MKKITILLFSILLFTNGNAQKKPVKNYYFAAGYYLSIDDLTWSGIFGVWTTDYPMPPCDSLKASVIGMLSKDKDKPVGFDPCEALSKVSITSIYRFMNKKEYDSFFSTKPKIK